jgi:hypothetical protein
MNSDFPDPRFLTIARIRDLLAHALTASDENKRVTSSQVGYLAEIDWTTAEVGSGRN